ncbi:MAG: type II secretion system secretin GspD [Saccharospirillaceae bacterium]|nr:type II secretion system secretin GspD [Pseudomonadales bacterium]NRB78873.1 type II secretion system secretin GspD [Saccharospirillaceae bacterium]
MNTINILARRLFLILTMTSLVLFTQFSVAQTKEEEPTWGLLFPNNDISELIEFVSKIVGKNFVVDQRVKGKVQIISGGDELTADEIYILFQEVLAALNYGLIEKDGFTSIVPTNQMRNLASKIDYTGDVEGNEFITAVIPVKNANVNDIIAILRPIIAKYGHIAPEKITNSVVIVDHADNIQRFRGLIKQFDIADKASIEIIELKNAWVGGIIPLLEKVNPDTVSSSGSGNSGTPDSRTVRVIADERSNRIILKGEKAARDELKALIYKLDVKSEVSSSSKVIFLENANATEMAAMLQGFAGVVQKTQQNNATSQAATSATAIIADESLDALIIRAEPALMAEIEAVIAQLDVVREQVLIEAAIVEIYGDLSNQFDISWATNPDAVINGGMIPAISSFGSSGQILKSAALGTTAVVSNLADLSGAAIGLIDPFSDVPNFGLIVSALESNNNVQVLSTPSITVINNEEGSIVVGQSVPFVTAAATETSGPTIVRQDVGTTLTVIPHIQRNNIVRLTVSQSSDSIASAQVLGAADLITNKRTINTEVLIKSGKTIVLGGLVSTSFSEGESRVPFLSRIPILGILFKSKTTIMKKTNLVVILRPTIIRGAGDELDAVTERKYLKVFDINLGGNGNLVAPSYDQIFDGELKAEL